MIDLIPTIIVLLTLWGISHHAKKVKAKERALKAWETRRANKASQPIVWVSDLKNQI